MELYGFMEREKKIPSYFFIITKSMMLSAERGFPYEGAKEHYILDVSRSDFAVKVVKVLAEVLPFPKSRKKNK